MADVDYLLFVVIQVSVAIKNTTKIEPQGLIFLLFLGKMEALLR